MDGYIATRSTRGLQRKDVTDMPIIEMIANTFEEDEKAGAGKRYERSYIQAA